MEASRREYIIRQQLSAIGWRGEYTVSHPCGHSVPYAYDLDDEQPDVVVTAMSRRWDVSCDGCGPVDYDEQAVLKAIRLIGEAAHGHRTIATTTGSSGTIISVNGIDIDFGRTLTPEEADTIAEQVWQRISQEIADAYALAGFGPIINPPTPEMPPITERTTWACPNHGRLWVEHTRTVNGNIVC